MHIPIRLNSLTRIKSVIPIALCGMLILGPACSLVHKKVEVERLLTPLAEANTADLIATVNKTTGVHSIHGRVDIQFEDTSFATAGIAEKYRTADGSITLQRPGKIYLIIQAPFVASDIAQMTSDGEHFRIAILKGDEKYRRFVKGTNNAVYAKLDMDGESSPSSDKKKTSEAQTVNALSNLRPQHLTDALLLRSIDPHAAGLFYAQSEAFESEKDPAKIDSNARIVRGYYLLDELQASTDNIMHLVRRFWFDRVGGIRLARLQTFDDKGVLIDDITYGPLTKVGEANTVMPIKISLTRPQEHYKVSITYQAPESITIDKDYPDDAFVLTNSRGLTEVDLDAKKPNPPKQ